MIGSLFVCEFALHTAKSLFRLEWKQSAHPQETLRC